MEKEKIYMGIDLGTDSCGWAVTNQNYEIISKGGKSLHGIRLFKEAESAENRRIKRSSKRRLDRRSYRIRLLQELFSYEIKKIDPLFKSVNERIVLIVVVFPTPLPPNNVTISPLFTFIEILFNILIFL